MGRKRGGARVLGPYYDDGREQWYVIAVDPGGARTNHRLGRGRPEEDARELADALRAEIDTDVPETVREAIEAWSAHVLASGAAEVTADDEKKAVRLLLERYGDIPVGQLTPRSLEQFVTDLGVPYRHHDRGEPKALAMATRRTYWLAACRMTAWWKKRGLTAVDLCAAVKARREKVAEPLPWDHRTGRKQIRRGKAQLRNLAEAKAYRTAALADPYPDRRVAALLPLLSGISSGELLHLRPCDVDLDAEVIYVRGEDDDRSDDWDVKTASRVRKLDLPPDCAEDLATLVADRDPESFVFRQDGARGGRTADPTRPRTASWLRDVVHAACERGKTRRVCPHGLRDTHASLRSEVAGESAARIGEALGHNDGGKTATAHYIGAQTRVPSLQVIRGGAGEGTESLPESFPTPRALKGKGPEPK